MSLCVWVCRNCVTRWSIEHHAQLSLLYQWWIYNDKHMNVCAHINNLKWSNRYKLKQFTDDTFFSYWHKCSMQGNLNCFHAIHFVLVFPFLANASCCNGLSFIIVEILVFILNIKNNQSYNFACSKASNWKLTGSTCFVLTKTTNHSIVSHFQFE